MTSKSSKDEVRQAAIRERELLLGATGVLNDADAVEGALVQAEDGPEEGKAWERRYDALGKG